MRAICGKWLRAAAIAGAVAPALAPAARTAPAPIVVVEPEPGAARLDLTIGREGWPVGCHVAQSSGDSRTDAAACRLFVRAAPGAPAPFPVRRDRRGRPIRYHQTVGLQPSFLRDLPR